MDMPRMEMPRDDALFEALARNKKQRRRRIWITVICILVAVALIITGLVFVLRKRVRERFAYEPRQVLSAQAVTGTLSTVVSGTGTLQESETESLTVPAGVEILELLVEAQEQVTQGQLLATVDVPSVLTAMETLQKTLTDLDADIREAAGDTVDTFLTSGVAGRVKLIYAEAGESVVQCMMDHGALAVLSLDGWLALDIEGDLEAGETVDVLLADGKTVEGTVDAVLGGKATILVSDNGTALQEASVSRNGENLGSGMLYIHEPLSITGYAGTVRGISAAENRKVYQGTTLFQLSDTGTSAKYDALLRTRRETEEELLELLSLQRHGGLVAPFAGSVQTLDHDETLNPLGVATLSWDQEMTVTIAVDEGDILSLQLGQGAEITVPSLEDEVFEGALTKIDRTAAASGTYSAQVRLPKELGMLAGMTAEVSVRITGVEDTLLVPLEAIQRSRTGTFVYTTYDAETDTFGGEVSVTVGILGSTQAEVLEGLTPGQTVWYVKEQSIMDFFMSMGGMGGGSSGGSRPQNGGQRPPQANGEIVPPGN